ncbi:NAD/NADP octopine/nopaline dehydrogenase family protein [Virgibacillus byunsanensis]|uniref:NAD/NADP octopine/nopaline dehydrogenase family protein n=1 Tax=Virgibacillus byunsanensis TaxID=570945 RepID=A0ABW3LU61_9BACI
MRYAVIGGGNTGQAIASYLSLNEKKVKLYTRDSYKAKRISEEGLKLKGVYSANIKLKAYSSLSEVIADSEIIIIATTSSGHKPIINQIKPFLEKNQTIVFFPGYWGAVECHEILGHEIENKNITIAETSAMPFISKADNNGSVYINRIKNNVLISTLPTSTSLSISTSFLDDFPQLVQAKNIFETSLNNTNVVVHTPISLFNASRIDASEEFQFYAIGASPLAVRYIENLDNERRTIADLFQIKTENILTILNNFYRTNYSNLYDALPGLFPDAAAPTTFDHRYFTEDIPFGLVPISEIGKKAGIETPFTDSIINTASLFLNKNYRKDGVNFEGMTFEEISSLGSLTEKIN